MRKNLFMSFSLFLTLVLLAGCGKSEPTTTEYVPDGSNYEGEGEVQGGIKSDEELAALEEEASADASTTEDASSTTEDASYVDNSGHEPESYSSGNFQDYWQSDDYFDLEGYLYANGADNVYATNNYSYPVADDNNIDLYVATFYGEQWEITLMTGSGVTIGHTYCDDEGFLRKNPHYIVTAPLYEDGGTITIDSFGTTTNLTFINMLDTTIQYMKENRDSEDPLNGSGLNYISQPLL